MREEMYLNFEQYYVANTRKALRQMRQETKYEIAKEQLAAGVSEKIIARTMKLSPTEMKSIKEELGLL